MPWTRADAAVIREMIKHEANVRNRLLALALPGFLLPLLFGLAWMAVLGVLYAQRS